MAQSVIKISQTAWLGLTPQEQSVIQQAYVVDLAEQASFGVIIDNQGVNESTAGTTGGAQLGGAVANATYVDNAIQHGSYSAKGQLAVGILGAILGSSLDSQAQTWYHYRYAVRLGNGNIQYYDQVQSDAFRHPVGVCVSLPNIALIDQQLCTQTAAMLRVMYLGMAPLPPSYTPPPAPPAYAPPPPASVPQLKPAKVAESSTQTVQAILPVAVAPVSTQVNCKLGTLAPVRTSAEKCKLINGSLVDD